MADVIINICNMKGGVGKTTLSILFAKYLALKDYRVLLIDADPQGTATVHAGKKVFNEDGLVTKGIHILLADLMNGVILDKERIALQLCYVDVFPGEEFYLLPNTITSAVYDRYLESSNEHLVFFRNIIALLGDSFDVILIDSPPYISAFSFSAIRASNCLLIPAETVPQSVHSVELFLKVVKGYIEKGILSSNDLNRILIMPTKVKKTKTSQKAMSMMKQKYGDYMSSKYIPFVEVANKVFEGTLSLASVVRNAVKNNARSKRMKELMESLKEIERELVAPFLSQETLKRVYGA